jgi:hypothetical protein
MALQKTVNTPHGFQALNAYHRAESVSIIGKTRINFFVRSYKDSAESNEFASEMHSCVYDLNGENPLAQAYAHLKTLSEFSTAVNC